MCEIKMGGIAGRAYYPSKVSQARANSDLRYYQQHIKPQMDKEIDVGELVAKSLDFAKDQSLSMGASLAKSAINKILPGTKDLSFEGAYKAIRDSSANAEAYRMRNNAPGDLTGKAVWSKSKW